MQPLALRNCRRCLFWDKFNPKPKDGVMVSSCFQDIKRGLDGMIIDDKLTKASDTCRFWAQIKVPS